MQQLVDFIREYYGTNQQVALHEPLFCGNEKAYVADAIDSTFVSSVGSHVDDFEQGISAYTATKAIATVNGTAALHTALYLAGVQVGDLVITQALTFVATCNALLQLGAEPVFVDVSEQGYGLCPKALGNYLENHAFIDDEGKCRHSKSNKIIRAVMPMHTFGHPVDMDGLMLVCKEWPLAIIEDAAESLGSFYKGKHTGSFGRFAALSFNGNKIITTGGGGMILCQSETDSRRAKHITTTAKVAGEVQLQHDEQGFNYRMPNLNAAMGCAQLEQLDMWLKSKRELAQYYLQLFKNTDYRFVDEPVNCQSNFWLNTIVCPDDRARKKLMDDLQKKQIMSRPVWQLMHKLPMFASCEHDGLAVSQGAEQTLLNLPSSPKPAGVC